MVELVAKLEVKLSNEKQGLPFGNWLILLANEV